MRGILVAAVATFPFVAGLPAAAIDYTSQSRSVLAAAGTQFAGVTDSDSNSTLGPWNGTATAVWTDDFGTFTASGTQISNLAQQQISMSGTLSAAGTFGFYGGSADSALSVAFSLTSPSPYVSTFVATGDTDSSIGGNFAFNLNGSGLLPAGDYSLVAGFTVSGSGFDPGSGSYSFTLTILPEPTSAFLMLLSVALFATLRRRTFRR
jgi:hypothetical protein